MLGSYARALDHLGFAVRYFDLEAAKNRHARFSRAGRMLASYLPVEPWIRKANRDLFVTAFEGRVDLLLFAGGDVRAGALAQLKCSSPMTRIVLLWPDTMLNLGDATISCLPVCDLVGSYSSSAVPLLEGLGAREVAWLPFAIDPILFPGDAMPSADEQRRYACDIAFVGNHRPEREAALLKLLRAGLNVKVWGEAPWIKNAAVPDEMHRIYQGQSLFGPDFVKAIKSAKVSLNVIDPLNFPAANMRFFETYACGGAPLTSRCSEMEGEFPGGECGVYFDEADLVSRARELVADAELRNRIARNGRERALAGHTYEHRARKLIELLHLDDR